VKTADLLVDRELADIRSREAASEYTTLEGCRARVEALTAHLTTVRRLRLDYFGGEQ